MRVPIEVTGTMEQGTVFQESTHTGTVGAFGAMIHMSRLLPLNAEIEVTNRFSQQTERFRVVWVGPQHAGGLWEIGIEAFRTLEDFWGVRFPLKPAQP